MTTGDSKSGMVSGNEKYHERSLSIFEAEEILTGPPLTVNNVAVSGTPSTNDVLQYNGSAWTNTAMHTRNYEYKVQRGVPTTNYTGNFTDVAGFNGTDVLQGGQQYTVSCAEGDVGKVYEGQVPFEVHRIQLDSLPTPKTPIMLNVASPDLAFKFAQMASG